MNHPGRHGSHSAQIPHPFQNVPRLRREMLAVVQESGRAFVERRFRIGIGPRCAMDVSPSLGCHSRPFPGPPPAPPPASLCEALRAGLPKSSLISSFLPFCAHRTCRTPHLPHNLSSPPVKGGPAVQGWVAEWSNAHAWKACVPKRYRGFESPPIRCFYRGGVYLMGIDVAKRGKNGGDGVWGTRQAAYAISDRENSVPMETHYRQDCESEALHLRRRRFHHSCTGRRSFLAPSRGLCARHASSICSSANAQHRRDCESLCPTGAIQGGRGWNSTAMKRTLFPKSFDRCDQGIYYRSDLWAYGRVRGWFFPLRLSA